MDAIIQSIAGVPYDFNKPWPFWFFIGKIVSKAFFGDEEQLEWFNAVRVRTREFIAITNIQKKGDFDPNEWNIKKIRPQIVEVDFFKPQPGEDLKLFWKPAREIIYQKVQDYEWIIVSLDLTWWYLCFTAGREGDPYLNTFSGGAATVFGSKQLNT